MKTKRDHEFSALLWLGVAATCNPATTGARELALALAELHSDAANAIFVPTTAAEIWTDSGEFLGIAG